MAGRLSGPHPLYRLYLFLVDLRLAAFPPWEPDDFALLSESVLLSRSSKSSPADSELGGVCWGMSESSSPSAVSADAEPGR